ncbi:MAG: aromatic ring-hydroxylating dioxygenase subunit alpha [Proteobacteria bacterium]|uniref:(2Fe-2S)-binding protein n=1 Tax=Zoogloea sp. LCSB751 TaxID=1965277 RepID=UPI0009A50E15|nr:(2Fe-2S)-binding protein [Zoogloea sp. LCSB751]MBS0353523.1 aromatic ring-hydroxylating dioxygenase subunit alpha [Pseudomonadota bacterium]
MTFKCTDAFTMNSWLTIGPVSRVSSASKSAPYRTTLLEANIAAWREADGQVTAEADGASALVESHYGYLWVCPSGRPARPIFDFPEYAEAGRRIVDCDGIGVAVSHPRMIENFLDMGHFPYVHAHYLGTIPNTEVVPYEVKHDEVADELWADDCKFYQPKTSNSATQGLQVEYKYRVMQSASAMLYKTAFTRPDLMDAIGLFVQPHSEEHITAYCLLAYIDDTSSINDLLSFQHTIFGQDKPILENQIPRRMPLYPGAEIPTRCDAMSTAYRRWLLDKDVTYGTVRSAEAA